MADLVYLRVLATDVRSDYDDRAGAAIEDAADEIERLRRFADEQRKLVTANMRATRTALVEGSRLRAALSQIYDTLSATPQGRGTETLEIARAALAPTPHRAGEPGK